jgi:hypothetical protein
VIGGETMSEHEKGIAALPRHSYRSDMNDAPVKQDLEEVSEQLLVDAVTTCKLLSISISTLHALKRTDRLPDFI